MPLFEYRCAACGKRFEVLMRRAVTPACPACGSESVEKQLSAFAVGAASPARAAAPSGPSCGGCPHAGPSGGCGLNDN